MLRFAMTISVLTMLLVSSAIPSSTHAASQSGNVPGYYWRIELYLSIRNNGGIFSDGRTYAVDLAGNPGLSETNISIDLYRGGTKVGSCSGYDDWENDPYYDARCATWDTRGPGTYQTISLHRIRDDTPYRNVVFDRQQSITQTF